MSKRDTEGLMATLKGAGGKSAVKLEAAAPLPRLDKTEQWLNKNRGRPFNMYINPTDEKKIKALGVYLTLQGHRVPDSKIIKAAIQMATESPDLITALEAVIARDQRFKSVQSDVEKNKAIRERVMAAR
jgi:hypothetical protein